MVEINESSVRYQAITKLINLAAETALEKNLTKPGALAKIKQGTQIRLWLEALDTELFLNQSQIQRLVYCLTQISEINDFPSAPAIGDITRPNILIGQDITIINNNSFSGGTPFTSTVNIGTSTVDTFAVSAGSGAVWYFTLANGVNHVSGIAIATWLSDGSNIDYTIGPLSPSLGTIGIILSVDINSGNVRLRATAISNGWSVTGSRFLIP